VDDIVATMVDVVFPLAGERLPRDHHLALADALEHALPGLTAWPGLAVHRINVVAGSGSSALLSRRARLALRVRRDQVGALAALNGIALRVADCVVTLGSAQTRELVPYASLYAHLVAADDDDELAFQVSVERELQARGIRGRPICGRAHTVSIDGQRRLHGFSLMLDGLSRADAMQLLECGLGGHRKLGCGVFVPHRSAAAVRA
jgi:CRISPR-associated protein Cas6